MVLYEKDSMKDSTVEQCLLQEIRSTSKQFPASAFQIYFSHEELLHGEGYIQLGTYSIAGWITAVVKNKVAIN